MSFSQAQCISFRTTEDELNILGSQAATGNINSANSAKQNKAKEKKKVSLVHHKLKTHEVKLELIKWDLSTSTPESLTKLLSRKPFSHTTNYSHS